MLPYRFISCFYEITVFLLAKWLPLAVANHRFSRCRENRFVLLAFKCNNTICAKFGRVSTNYMATQQGIKSFLRPGFPETSARVLGVRGSFFQKSEKSFLVTNFSPINSNSYYIILFKSKEARRKTPRQNFVFKAIRRIILQIPY